MMIIEEISKDVYELKPGNEKILDVIQPQYFYKLDIFGTNFYLSSSFYKNQFVIKEINNHVLLCADNRIALFSPLGQIVIMLRIFEAIYIYRSLKNSFYLFSERMAFKFSKVDYSLENMIWLSDIIEDVEEQSAGFKILCFDSSLSYI